MRSPIPKSLDQAVDEICNDVFAETPPRALAHYTKEVDTVFKIASSRCLWATECTKATGGERDLQVATPTILAVLLELAREYPDIGDLLQKAHDRYERGDVLRHVRVYVACFTPHGDNRDMWASRSGGLGFGASITVDMLKEEKLEFDDRGGGMYPVEYVPANLHRDVKAAMRRVLDIHRQYARAEGALYTGGSGARTEGAIKCLFSGIYRVAAIAATRSKDPESAYQKEWRVNVLPNHGRDIEEEPGIGPPHALLPLRAKHHLPVIERVVIGPNVENAAAKIEELRARFAQLTYGVDGVPMPEIVSSACARVESTAAPSLP